MEQDKAKIIQEKEIVKKGGKVGHLMETGKNEHYKSQRKIKGNQRNYDDNYKSNTLETNIRFMMGLTLQ